MKNVYLLYALLGISIGLYSQTQCSTNGGFETPLTTLPNPYTFSTSTPGGGFNVAQCNLPTAGFANVTTAIPLNNAASPVSLVSAGVEPTLAMLGINTVSTVNNGTRAIRLNMTPNPFGVDNGMTNLTAMSKTFTVTGSSVDFSFSLIVKNPAGHPLTQQPFFSVRLYDNANNPINTNQVCVQADPANCIFNNFYNAATMTDPILYTGWQCARINIPSQFMGQVVRLEFLMADCGQTAHNGTVYIDDICTTNCSNPVFGSIQLDPVNSNCPTAPFTICGTYQAPFNSTYASMSLDIIQNGATVGTISAPSSFTATSFCFTLNPSDFGSNPSGTYEFEVNALFNVNCPITPYQLILFDDTGTVTFNNCCVPVLVIAATTLPSPDEKEASVRIEASNVVNPGVTAIYHAGEDVLLKPGFNATSGSHFRGYIEGCSGDFEARIGNFNQQPTETEELPLITESDRDIEFFNISPNPANSVITITGTESIQSILITSLDGKVLYSNTLRDKTNSFDVVIDGFSNGMYNVTVTTADGKTQTQKLVKN